MTSLFISDILNKEERLRFLPSGQTIMLLKGVGDAKTNHYWRSTSHGSVGGRL
jgi:hypothetical protein